MELIFGGRKGGETGIIGWLRCYGSGCDATGNRWGYPFHVEQISQMKEVRDYFRK